MQEHQRQIFRLSALRHYYQKRQPTTIPVYLSRRLFVIGWLSLLFLLGIGVLIANVACPLYVPIQAYPLEIIQGSTNTLILALLLPVDATLQAGKSVQLIDSETGQFLTDAVTITPLQAVSSAELEGIVVGQNQGLYQVAVNLHDFPLSDSLMQHIHVRIQMGTTPLYSLLGLSQAMTGTP